MGRKWCSRGMASARGIVQALRNPHVWALACLMALFTAIYYGEYLRMSEWMPFGKAFFTASYPHDLHRALFLIPMLHAAARFQLKGAAVISFAVFCIVLPYSIVVSPEADPVMRAVSFIVVASLATVLLGLAQDRWLRLKEERDFISALVDTAGALVLVLDPEGRIVRFNRACERTTGFSSDEVLGKHVWDIFLLPEEVPLAKDVLRGLPDGQLPSKHENYWVTKDGSRRLISWSNTPVLDYQGSIQFVLSTGIDITEQRQAEENMRIYAELVTEAQEEERKRIARELHDDTAQELASLALDMDLLINSPKGLSTTMVNHLEKFRDKADHILRGVRRFSQDLRPSLLEDFGLLVALQWMTEDLSNHYMLSSSVNVIGEPRRLSDHTELVLFRIAQEALSNVRKHARATRATVQLEFSPDKVILTVTDNGQGFEVPKATGDFVRLGKLGIVGMYERARLINGDFAVESEPGKGTRVRVELNS